MAEWSKNLYTWDQQITVLLEILQNKTLYKLYIIIMHSDLQRSRVFIEVVSLKSSFRRTLFNLA